MSLSFGVGKPLENPESTLGLLGARMLIRHRNSIRHFSSIRHYNGREHKPFVVLVLPRHQHDTSSCTSKLFSCHCASQPKPPENIRISYEQKN